jgi:hypothetical protein
MQDLISKFFQTWIKKTPIIKYLSLHINKHPGYTWLYYTVEVPGSDLNSEPAVLS